MVHNTFTQALPNSVLNVTKVGQNRTGQNPTQTKPHQAKPPFRHNPTQINKNEDKTPLFMKKKRNIFYLDYLFIHKFSTVTVFAEFFLYWGFFYNQLSDQHSNKCQTNTDINKNTWNLK